MTDSKKWNVVNTWDGSVGDEGSRIETDDQPLERAIKKGLADYFLGISVLSNGGELVDFGDDIEEFLIFQGVVAIVEEHGRKFFATIFMQEETLAGNNDLILINIEDIAKPKIPVIVNGERNPQYKFVIFENNRLREPILPGESGYFMRKIVNIVRKMEIDLFTGERRVMTTVPQQPAREDVDYQISTFQSLFFTYIAMEHSRTPTAEQAKAGLTGIRPSQIGQPQYIEPKVDLQTRYIQGFNFGMSKLEQFMGVRNDPLAEKDDRAPVSEVSNSTAPYEAGEKKGGKSRMRGIKDGQNTFEPHADYELTYGRYSGPRKK